MLVLALITSWNAKGKDTAENTKQSGHSTPLLGLDVQVTENTYAGLRACAPDVIVHC